MTSSHRSKPVNLAGRSIFVTGGTGFIGRSLLDYLHTAARDRSDFQVTVLSRDPTGFLARYPEYHGQAWLRFVQGDLGNLPESDQNYTDVIHGAADTHSAVDPIVWLDQLVEGTRSVLDYALKTGASRFLLFSSGAVYGQQAPSVEELLESTTTAPSTTDVAAVYAHGKRLAETLCALYGEHRGLTCVIARCFAVISKHVPLNGPYAAGNFLRDALDTSKDHLSVRGDGKAVRTYLDGRDMAHWTFTLLLKGASGQAYNLGSDQPITMSALAELVAEIVAPDKSVKVEKKQIDSARSIYVPGIQKAKSLGLQVETPIDVAIAEAAKGLKG